MKAFAIQDIKSAVTKKGYKYTSSNKPYDPFIFGIRNKDITNVDHFNDIIGMIFFDDKGVEQIYQFQATTKPGLDYLKNHYGNHKDRTGILCEGQYLQALVSRYPVVGKFPATPTDNKFMHQNIMYALGQMGGAIRYYQDYVLDGKISLDPKTITQGYVGCNIHSTKAGYHTDSVWNWSALCQVILDYNLFETEFMVVIEKAWILRKEWMFSYTLFNEIDF